MNLKGTLSGNAKATIRRMAGRNLPLWQAYLRLRGSPLPDPKQIDLVLEGYPRSGNTYAEHMLRIMCPALHWVSHTHSTGTLLLARKHRIPALILIREPEEAAVSFYIYQMKRVSMSICIEEWASFYEKAQTLDLVEFLSFNSLTSDTQASLCASLEKLGLAKFVQNPLPQNPRASFQASHDHDKWHLREVRGIPFGEEQGNRPSKKRENLKAEVFTHLQTCEDSSLKAKFNICKQIARNLL